MEQKYDFLDLGNSLKSLWKYYIVYGISFMILGVLGLFYPEFFALYIVYVIGFFFIFAGIGSMVSSIKGKSNPSYNWGTMLFLGILEVISGFIIIFNPLYSAFFLTIYIGVLLIFRGFVLVFAKHNTFGIIGDVNATTSGLRSLNIVSGILDIIIGIAALVIPIFAAEVFIYVLVFYLIFGGLLILIYGAQVKSTINHVKDISKNGDADNNISDNRYN